MRLLAEDICLSLQLGPLVVHSSQSLLYFQGYLNITVLYWNRVSSIIKQLYQLFRYF